MIVGIMYVASTTTYIPIDSYGSTTSATVNETGTLLETVTSTGVSAGAGLLLLFACLSIIAGAVMIRTYSGR